MSLVGIYFSITILGPIYIYMSFLESIDQEVVCFDASSPNSRCDRSPLPNERSVFAPVALPGFGESAGLFISASATDVKAPSGFGIQIARCHQMNVVQHASTIPRTPVPSPQEGRESDPLHLKTKVGTVPKGVMVDPVPFS